MNYYNKYLWTIILLFFVSGEVTGQIEDDKKWLKHNLTFLKNESKIKGRDTMTTTFILHALLRGIKADSLASYDKAEKAYREARSIAAQQLTSKIINRQTIINKIEELRSKANVNAIAQKEEINRILKLKTDTITKQKDSLAIAIAIADSARYITEKYYTLNKGRQWASLADQLIISNTQRAIDTSFAGIKLVEQHNQNIKKQKATYAIISKEEILAIEQSFNHASFWKYRQKELAHSPVNIRYATSPIRKLLPTSFDSLFITIGRDASLKLWNIKTKRSISFECSKDDFFLSAVLSDDGKQVLGTTKNGYVIIFPVSSTAKPIKKRFSFPITKALFLESKQELIVCARDREPSLFIWNFIDDKIKEEIDIPKELQDIPIIALTSDLESKNVVIKTIYRNYELNLNNRTILPLIDKVEKLNKKSVFNLNKVDFTYIENQLLSGQDLLQKDITAIAFSKDHNLILTGNVNGIVNLWNDSKHIILKSQLGAKISQVGFFSNQMVIITDDGHLYSAPLPSFYRSEKDKS